MCLFATGGGNDKTRQQKLSRKLSVIIQTKELSGGDIKLI